MITNYNTLKKIALNSSKLTIKDLLIEIGYYSEGEDIFNKNDLILEQILYKTKITENINKNVKLLNEIKQIEKLQKNNSFLRFGQILMNLGIIKIEENQYLKHFLNLNFLFFNIGFYKNDGFGETILNGLSKINSKYIDNFLQIFENYQNNKTNYLEKEKQYINILLNYQVEKEYGGNENEIMNSLFEEIKKENLLEISKLIYFGTYQLISGLIENKNYLHFIKILDNIENDKLEFSKKIILNEIKRTGNSKRFQFDKYFTNFYNIK